MSGGWRTLALLTVLVLAAFGLMVHSKLLSANLNLTLSKYTVSPGDSVSATGSLSMGSYYTNVSCIGSTSVGSGYGNCGSTSGYCFKPCTPVDFSSYYGFNTFYKMGVQFFGAGGDPYYGKMRYYVGSSSYDTGGADLFLIDSSSYSGSSTTYNGFMVMDGETLTIGVRFESDVSFSTLGGVVMGFCFDNGDGSRGSVTVPTGWHYFRTVSGSWHGKSWTCELYYNNDNTSSEYSVFQVHGADPYTSVYFAFSARCFWGSNCPSGSHTVDVSVEDMYVSSGGIVQLTLEDPDNVFNGESCVWKELSGDSASNTWNLTVRSDAPQGTHQVRLHGYYLGDDFLFLKNRTSYYVECGDKPADVGTKSVSVDVQLPATNVSLYSYGSNGGSPSQEPDDHYLRGRIYVSGGTLFDSVKLYVDNVQVASYSKSSFTCTSSYCYRDFTYSMQGRSDGSHTVKAELIVNGSVKDTEQKSFNYYEVGVRNVSASQAGNDNVSVSFDYKGGHKSYQIYIDSTSCVVASNDSFSPSTSHNWLGFGPRSFSIPSCARTSGTHTLYVKLCDESGLCKTDSTSVDFTFTYNYSVSLDQPVAGTKNLATDVRGSPPSSYSEPFSITYSTDDPSGATLKLVVGGSEYESWTVTGSGVKSGSVPSNYLSCGDTVFTAEISGSSGSDQSSAVVHYVCWYANIDSPVGSVVVPSEDNISVSPGTDLTLLGIVDVSPPDVEPIVNAYLDGTSLSPVSCPSGYTHCFDVPVGGLSCGSTHELKLEAGDGSNVYVQTVENFTLNCRQRYVRIVSPADGSVFEYNVPLSEVNLDVQVDYAGGDELRFKLNGSDVDLPESNDTCTHSACYVIPGSMLSLGTNVLEANLYQGGSPVASDSVSFTVYLWQFIVGEEWSVTPPYIYVEEHGSHPDACYVFHDDNLEYMVYSADESKWEFPIDESYVGKTVEVFCSKDSRVVYDVNYTVSGPGTQPASPVVGGGGGAVKVVSRVAFPVFPERRQVDHYIYSVYHFMGREPGDNLKDVYVSQGRLCIVPRAGKKYNVEFKGYDFGSFPESDNDVKQILGHVSVNISALSSHLKYSGVECFDIKGSGVFAIAFRDAVYYVLLLDVSKAVAPINLGSVVVVLLVLALIYYMAARG